MTSTENKSQSPRRGVPNFMPTDGKYRKGATFPSRFTGVIYQVQPLWMAEVYATRIDFDFAVEYAELRLRDSGYLFRLVSIYAAKGFPWPIDVAQSSRKDTRNTTIPTHLTQLRDALAQAVAISLKVEMSGIKDLQSVIKAATTPEASRNRVRTLHDNNVESPIEKHQHVAQGNPSATNVIQRLNEREIMILAMIGEGFSYKSISKQLEVKHKTIAFYMSAIFGKLDLDLMPSRDKRAAAMAMYREYEKFPQGGFQNA